MNNRFPVKLKVVAYITGGRRLLVFSHADFPEAGIQVPAGTVYSICFGHRSPMVFPHCREARML